MHFNSADGLDANDRLEPVPIGQHTHYNYGLTQPGNYEATFRASGRLNPWQGGQDTSSTGTFKFSVPFSSVATGEAALRLALDEEPDPLLFTLRENRLNMPSAKSLWSRRQPRSMASSARMPSALIQSLKHDR